MDGAQDLRHSILYFAMTLIYAIKWLTYFCNYELLTKIGTVNWMILITGQIIIWTIGLKIKGVQPRIAFCDWIATIWTLCCIWFYHLAIETTVILQGGISILFSFPLAIWIAETNMNLKLHH